MDAFLDILKILLPAAVVLYAMYLVVKSFISKEIEKARLEVRGRSIETVLPNRLQAYERMALFLERMHPQNMMVRLNVGQMPAVEFQSILLSEIRNEYNHNVSQQVYMSNESWELIVSAKEDLILTINEATSKCNEKSTSTDLSRLIIESMAAKPVDPISNALRYLKDEIRQTF